MDWVIPDTREGRPMAVRKKSRNTAPKKRIAAGKKTARKRASPRRTAAKKSAKKKTTRKKSARKKTARKKSAKKKTAKKKLASKRVATNKPIRKSTPASSQGDPLRGIATSFAAHLLR